MSHPNCERPNRHICQKPSGRTCIEAGCDRSAGTLWGPLWCPEHDAERLDRIAAGFDAISEQLREIDD